MNKKNYITKDKVSIKFVPELPDLITYNDKKNENNHKRVKIKIELTDDGIEILGDSPFDHTLDDLLIQSGVKEIQQVLCG